MFRLIDFRHWGILVWDLPFDVAQGGESAEPFRISRSEFSSHFQSGSIDLPGFSIRGGGIFSKLMPYVSFTNSVFEKVKNCHRYIFIMPAETDCYFEIEFEYLEA